MSGRTLKSALSVALMCLIPLLPLCTLWWLSSSILLNAQGFGLKLLLALLALSERVSRDAVASITTRRTQLTSLEARGHGHPLVMQTAATWFAYSCDYC